MSDATQGEGWWQASDGKWYPPEQHPEFQAGVTQPVESVPPAPPTQAMPGAPIPPPPGTPAGPPPGGPPPGAPPGAPGAGSSNAKWIVAGVLGVAAVAIAAFLLLGGDDKKSNVAVTSSSSPSSSSSTKSSSSSSKSSSSSSKSSSSSSSSSGTSDADVQKKMLTGSEVGPGFIDSTFAPDNGPTNCGADSLNTQVPPKRDVGSASASGVASFQEEARAYGSSADAQKVLDLIKAETTCPNPTIPGGEPVQFSAPKDVTAQMTTPVEEAIEIDFQTPEATGQFFVIKDTVAVVTFGFAAQKGTDLNQLPDALSVVNKGLKKIVS